MLRRRFISQSFDFNNYLTVEALEDNTDLYASTDSDDPFVSVNGGEFSPILGGAWGIILKKGDKCSFKSTTGKIHINGQVGSAKVYGNILSLVYGDEANQHDPIESFSFSSLFAAFESLIEVSSDFLPFKILTPHCYSGMFSGCKNLEKAPELPAETLVASCYTQMFQNCKKLNYIKMLASEIYGSGSDYDSLYNWVNGVSSTGTFVKNPAMTSLSTGVNGIPEGWTVVDDGADEGMTLDLKGGDNGNAGVQLYEYMFTNSEYDGSFYYWYPTAADNITITHGAFNKAKVTSAYITQRGYTWVLSFEGQGDWVAYLGDDGYLDIYNSMD